MSGIYLIVLLLVWGFLTRLLWKNGRRFLEASFANRPVRIVLVVIAGTLWFGGSFWEAGGKKLYWDAKVQELCAKDGGVKVYETVKLSPELYDYYAGRNWVLPERSRAKPTDDYYVETEEYYYRKLDPQVARRQSRIIRRSDGKVLGEYIHYSRGGGDIPGPWHGTSFSCLNLGIVKFETAIFIKGDE